MSKLWVLFITSGLVLRSDCEELDDARGRRLQRSINKTVGFLFGNWAINIFMTETFSFLAAKETFIDNKTRRTSK